MSRTLFIDPIGGIAGDMLAGALIEVGADLAEMQAALITLGIPNVQVRTESVHRGPFVATHFQVETQPEDHPHRTWADIQKMISSCGLSDGIKRRALAIFERIAQAEATVHGIDIKDVHFHEVGAWDSIADIVSVAVGLEALNIDRVVAGSPPLSSGTIHTAHGQMPLPAPATVNLLEGWPIRGGPHGRESTTPTGAGILAALAEPGSLPDMRILKSGIGAGTRNPEDQPNVTRAILGVPSSDDTTQNVYILEAQMDDLTGEHLPPLIEALLRAGALDAYATPVLMKKGRSGLLVTALTQRQCKSAVTDALLRHGSTFGVRESVTHRTILERIHETVQTPWGPVRVKVGSLQGEIFHASPEYEDVQSIALSAGQPAPIVHAAALQAWRNSQES